MMGLLVFLLVMAVAANAAGSTPAAPSLNELVDRVFQLGGIFQELGCNTSSVEVQDFDMWDDLWWFWAEFYEGHISGLPNGFRRFGDCAYEMGKTRSATCAVRLTGLSLHYHWRLGAKDFDLEPGKQRRNPLQLIDAGTMKATVGEGTTRLHLRKRSWQRYFRAQKAEVGLVELQDVLFSNTTIVWNGWWVETKAEHFQWALRHMLASRIKDYIQSKNFLTGFNRAFVKAQK